MEQYINLNIPISGSTGTTPKPYKNNRISIEQIFYIIIEIV
jgi:hypothetical protein